jgi:UDP-N-acetylglucosamine 4-epimerase
MQTILITGGAGFIGSNLCEYFLNKGYNIICLDNLSTGFKKNIEDFINNPNFTFIEGDIRNLETCIKVSKNVDFVLHQAALGSVPRSINNPINTNDVNINGFLNILQASKENNVRRFVYAASSSTYGDSSTLPKIENNIGKPLSPYAVTKFVNELYADVFARIYHIECIGLRYFNVFGKRQDPNGSYAAVIPLWVKQLINHQRPTINGNGDFSRDFTYVANVIEANERAILTSSKNLVTPDGYINQIFNVAYGHNTTLNELFMLLRENLSKFDCEISKIEPIYGPLREGDIPHSLASIEKAKSLLEYSPQFSALQGFKLATEWYWNNIK